MPEQDNWSLPKGFGKWQKDENWKYDFRKLLKFIDDMSWEVDLSQPLKGDFYIDGFEIEAFIENLLSSQAHTLKEQMKALCGEEIPIEPPYDDEEKALMVEIWGTSASPDYIKERRYGMEVQRKRMLSAIESIK